MVIPDVRSSDDNTYTCVASNYGGNATSNATKLTATGMTMYSITESQLEAEINGHQVSPSIMILFLYRIPINVVYMYVHT